MDEPLVTAVAGGFGPEGFVESMTPALQAAGWRVVPLKAHFRGAHNRADGDRFPRAMLRLAVGYCCQMEDQREGIIGIGHSMAGVALVIAALLNPKRFKALVLINLAGFLKHDSLPALAVQS